MRFTGFILFFLACTASAQSYLGGGVGYGETHPNRAHVFNAIPGTRSVQETRSETWTAFAGYRLGPVGLEAGFIRLPKYRSIFDTKDYPLYKGLAPGSYPQTAYVTQSIDAQTFYLRLNAYGPRVLGIQPYIAGGYAITRSHNVERALYDGVDTATNDIKFRSRRALIALGAEVRQVRMEFVRIDGATDNPHTLRRDVRMVNVSLIHRF